MIIRGIPSDVTTEEVKSELEDFELIVDLIKCFGPSQCPCAWFQYPKHPISKTSCTFMNVSMNAFKNSGPSHASLTDGLTMAL